MQIINEKTLYLSYDGEKTFVQKDTNLYQLRGNLVNKILNYSCIYYGKKYGLDYKKKIRFEYRYYKLKKMIYRVLKNQKAERMNEIIQYLNENYIKILRKY